MLVRASYHAGVETTFLALENRPVATERAMSIPFASLKRNGKFFDEILLVASGVQRFVVAERQCFNSRYHGKLVKHRDLTQKRTTFAAAAQHNLIKLLHFIYLTPGFDRQPCPDIDMRDQSQFLRQSLFGPS